MAKRKTKNVNLSAATGANPNHTAEKLCEVDRRDVYILALEEQNLAHEFERVRGLLLAKRRERIAKVHELCTKHAATGLDPITGALTREPPAPSPAPEANG